MSFLFLVSCLVLNTCPEAAAQSAREQSEALTLYQQANSGPAGPALRAAVRQQSAGQAGEATFQLGRLRTFGGHSIVVPGLRYHAGLRLLEVQDSIDLDSTHFWPAGSLRGFDIGDSEDNTTPLRRFRSRLVKEGSSPHPDFVEVLTTIDAGPLLLAWLYVAEPAANGRRALTGILVAGPGTTGEDPLRPITLTPSAVLHLFGSRTKEVRSFAEEQKLDYTHPADIARMMNHYNRVAVVK